MSLKFGRIHPWTAELAALDQFKKSFIREHSKYFDDLLSGELSLPIGLLVFFLNGPFSKNVFDFLKVIVVISITRGPMVL